MRSILNVVVMISLFQATGCATVIAGRSQTLNVTTSDAAQGQCLLQDKNGRQYRVTAPGSVLVKRGDGPLDVQCSLPGGEGQRQVSENVEPWIIANVLWGVFSPIALIVDATTGSYQRYPEDVVVPIIPVASAPMPTNSPMPLQ
jgi:hypothetical protein